MEQKCETFLYSAEHQLSDDNDGWTLWLPGMFSKYMNYYLKSLRSSGVEVRVLT